MHVETIRPQGDAVALLSHAQFADAYRIAVNDAALDARRAAERMFARRPRWIGLLMHLRDAIVRHVGLKTASHARQSSCNLVGFFPVLSETPQRLVAGLDDSHLDFRVVIDITEGVQRRVTATTLVHTHNRLGRAYLAIIAPFHRAIVRAMLRQVAAAPR